MTAAARTSSFPGSPRHPSRRLIGHFIPMNSPTPHLPPKVLLIKDAFCNFRKQCPSFNQHKNFTCVHAKSLQSSDFATPRTVAHQAPLTMRFSKQEYWSGVPCPPPGVLPNPGMESASLMYSCIGRRVLYH